MFSFSTERFIDGRRALIGGLADRMKGASTVMLLSIALGRRFEIEWNHPEDIRRIFDYSEYDWSLSDDNDGELEVDLIDRNFSTEIRKYEGRIVGENYSQRMSPESRFFVILWKSRSGEK